MITTTGKKTRVNVAAEAALVFFPVVVLCMLRKAQKKWTLMSGIQCELLKAGANYEKRYVR